MEQCPNVAEVPVVFEVSVDPPRVQWVCEEHYESLTEFKMARLATDNEIREQFPGLLAETPVTKKPNWWLRLKLQQRGNR